MIRDILKFQQVFVDGRGYAGVASAIEVPKVEQVMRDYSALAAWVAVSKCRWGVWKN